MGVAKGSNFMGVRPGSVVQKKTLFPKALTDAGFTTIDAFAMAADGTVYLTKGTEYIGLKAGAITTPGGKKAAFPKAISDAFPKVQGMSITADGTVYVAADGQWMSVGSGDVVKDKKQAFPKALTDAGFSAIDGMHIDASGVTTVAKDAYYMTVNAGVVVTKKSPIPSTLRNTLCGADTLCYGESGKTLDVSTVVAASTAKKGTASKANLPQSLFAL